MAETSTAHRTTGWVPVVFRSALVLTVAFFSFWAISTAVIYVPVSTLLWSVLLAACWLAGWRIPRFRLPAIGVVVGGLLGLVYGLALVVILFSF